MRALELGMVHGHHQDANPVNVKALHRLVQVQDIGARGGVVQHAVITAGVLRAAGFIVQEGIRHPRIDDLVDGYPLRVLQDGGQGLHMVLVRMGDEPEVHVAAGLLDPLPQMRRLGGVPAIHHDHLAAQGPEQVGIADGILHRRNLHQREMTRFLGTVQFLVLLAPGADFRGAADQGQACRGRPGNLDEVSSVHNHSK